MKPRWTLFWATVFCVVAGAACQGSGDGSPGPAPRAEAGQSLLDDVNFQKAFRQVSAQAGPDAYALEFDLYPDKIVLKARDPRAKTKVLQHTYQNGRLEAPVEVRLLGSGTLEDNLFPMSEVEWIRLPGVAQEARAQVDPAGSVSHLLVRRSLPHETSIRMRAYVSSPIRDGYVDADAQGKLLTGG